MTSNRIAKSRLAVLTSSAAALLLSLTACGSSGSSGSGVPVGLGAAGAYVVLAKTAVTVVPTCAVTGNVGISPNGAVGIAGLALTMDSTNVFSTAPQVTGRIYAADYTPPTPANMTAAIAAMETAFTDAAGRAAGVTELGAGDIGGQTLRAGVYKWGTGLSIPTSVTLSGGASDVWIFQIAQNLTVANGVRVNLSGGALAKNVFWQVSGAVTLGTTSHLEGIVLSQTAITAQTGAVVIGRLLAQSAVTIDGATVTDPG
jgi:hypothetical protein